MWILKGLDLEERWMHMINSLKWYIVDLLPFFFFINFYWSIVALQYCTSFCCTAKWIRLSYALYPLLCKLSSYSGDHSILSRVLCVLYSIFSLVIYFIHSINSVYVLIPVSQLLLPPPFPLEPYICSCNCACYI